MMLVSSSDQFIRRVLCENFVLCDLGCFLFNSDFNLASRYSRKLIGKRSYVENITEHQTWNSCYVPVYSHINLKSKVRQ